MSTPSDQVTPQPESSNKQPIPGDDKRLERVYDYTKFHIGIYLSIAGGIAALLGSKEANFQIATLIGNQYFAYLSLVLLIIAGMCGGIVATSVSECASWEEFWSQKDFSPATLQRWTGKGRQWIAREHGFFWASLISLGIALLLHTDGKGNGISMPLPNSQCCCACTPSQPPCSKSPPLFSSPSTRPDELPSSSNPDSASRPSPTNK